MKSKKLYTWHYFEERFITLFFYFLIQSIISDCKAQKNNRNIDMIFAQKHYSFAIIPLLDQKGSIMKSMDKYWIHSTIMHGFEAGFSRYSHLDKEHSLMVGLFFGAFARNFNYDIPGEEFNPPFDGHITSNKAVSREFNFTGSIPVLFEKRWFRNENNFWNGDIGITIRYTPSEDVVEEHVLINSPNSHVTYLNIQLNTNYTKKPWLNYNLGGGYCWILKNNNLFKTNLVVNLSFTSFVKGRYQFTIPNQPIVEGRYEVKGSYIGLSLSYVFTGTNKRLIREHEKKKAF
jgi:hypothetical protein